MNGKHIIAVFLLLSIGSSCSKEEFKNLLLSDIIVGKWEMREQLGFPYSPTEWHVFEEPDWKIEFFENGRIIFEQSNGTFEGDYSVNDSLSTITFDIQFEVTWSISHFTECEFIVDFETDEGVTRHKHIKVK